MVLTPALLLLSLTPATLAVRCYVCRSDELPDCGDPFRPGRVPASECDNFFTQQTFACFKATQYAAGQYITVRGCAPFTTDVFPGLMQKGMVGTYWKVRPTPIYESKI